MARAAAATSVTFAVSMMVGPAAAFDPLARPADSLDQAAFVFGGRVKSEGFTAEPNPFSADYENNFVLGAGYQRDLVAWAQALRIGAEVGVLARFGESASGEFWGGLSARYHGLDIFDTVRFAPSLTVGLSAITEAMSGRESRSEFEDEGDATLLFYLGPELAFSLVKDPQTEIFWRLHHRSGAWETLGNMQGAADAHVVGLRRRF